MGVFFLCIFLEKEENKYMDVLQAIVKLIADTSSLQKDINKQTYTAKVNADTSQAQKAVSDLARLSQQKTMQT